MDIFWHDFYYPFHYCCRLLFPPCSSTVCAHISQPRFEHVFLFINVLQNPRAVAASNGFEVWIETVTSAVQTANNNGKVPVTGVDHPASPNVHTFCWKVVCFVVGCVWEFAMGRIQSLLRFGSIWGDLAFWKDPSIREVLLRDPGRAPGPVVNSLTRIIGTCAWHSRSSFQSVALTNLQPTNCWRFVQMLPSRFRSSWFYPPTFSDPCFQQPRGYGSDAFQSHVMLLIHANLSLFEVNRSALPIMFPTGLKFSDCGPGWKLDSF